MTSIKYIIIEGIDKSGKSTFKDEFNRKTNRSYFVIDRGFGSLIAYGKHNTRPVNFKHYYTEDTFLAKRGGVVIYLYANTYDIDKRMIEHNETDILHDEIIPLMLQYDNYLKQTKMKVIKINTSNLDLVQSVDYAIKELNKIGPNYYELKD